MKLRVTRAASAFILAATLLAGCGEPAGQSSYAPSAVQAVQTARSTAQLARSAAQDAADNAKKAASGGSSSALSLWPQPLRSLQVAGSAAASGASVADWWQGILSRLARESHASVGGGKVPEIQPQPR